MTSSLKRLLSTVAAAATLPFALLGAPSASAAVLAMGDCTGEWQLSAPNGNPPTQTLTCIPANTPTVPSCNITGNSTGTPGGTVVLTANCSQPPILSYAWTLSGGSCTNGTSSSTCTATLSSGLTGSVTYGLVATNAQGPSLNTTKTVNWTTSTAPSGCSLSLSSTSVAAGNAVDLTAQCSSANVASWTWGSQLELLDAGPTQGAGAGSNQVSTIGAQAGVYTITATPKNSDGVAGPIQSKQLTVTSGTSGGGGTTGGTIAACTGFTKTKVMDLTYGADGSGTAPRKYVTDSGVFRNNATAGFGATEALIVVFKAPPTDAEFTLGVTHSGGSLGSSATRTFVLSTKPCDFAYPAGPDAVWANVASVMSLRLSSGTPSAGRYDLVPGKEYYLNVKNSAAGGTVGCGVSRCDVFVSSANP